MKAPQAGDWVIVSDCRNVAEGVDVAVLQVERLEQRKGQPLGATLSDDSWWNVKTCWTERLHAPAWGEHRIRVATASELRAGIRSSIGPALRVANLATLATLYDAVLAANARRT